MQLSHTCWLEADRSDKSGVNCITSVCDLCCVTSVRTVCFWVHLISNVLCADFCVSMNVFHTCSVRICDHYSWHGSCEKMPFFFFFFLDKIILVRTLYPHSINITIKSQRDVMCFHFVTFPKQSYNYYRWKGPFPLVTLALSVVVATPAECGNCLHQDNWMCFQ